MTGSSGADTLSVALSLFGVIAIIVLMLWLARFFKKKYGSGGLFSSKHIKIEDVAALSPDSRIAVVRVGTRLFLLGITAGSINHLCELSEDDLPPPEDESGEQMSFADSFKAVMAQKFTKGNKQ
jgi:flagellar biosynthetic protein FliO